MCAKKYLLPLFDLSQTIDQHEGAVHSQPPALALVRCEARVFDRAEAITRTTLNQAPARVLGIGRTRSRAGSAEEFDSQAQIGQVRPGAGKRSEPGKSPRSTD